MPNNISSFSIVIPLYNKATSISRAIRSVLNQSIQNFEIVVVNDGSTDNSADIVRSINDPRIFLINQENQGVSAARNRGIEIAHHDLIAFLDGDDEWLPEFLETILRLADKYPYCGLYATRYYVCTHPDKQQPAIINGVPSSFEGILKDYFKIAVCSHPPVWTGATCARKSALEIIGGFPVGVASGEDLLTWAKINAFYSFAYSMKCLSIYRPSLPDSYPAVPCRIPADPDIVGQELQLLLNCIDEIHRNALRKYCSHWHKMRASSYLSLGMKVKARHDIHFALTFNFNIKLVAYFCLSFLPTNILKYIFRKLTIDRA